VTGGFNFNWMNFVQAGARASTSAMSEDDVAGDLLIGYPNPVIDRLYVSNVEDGAPVGIIDLSGKLILRTAVEDRSVDMRTFQSGVYLVQIQSKNKLLRMRVMKK
jgi:hypothetical protein